MFSSDDQFLALIYFGSLPFKTLSRTPSITEHVSRVSFYFTFTDDHLYNVTISLLGLHTVTTLIVKTTFCVSVI